jgi:phosphatidylinositol alpha 1,6-mannosyltransferase
VSIYDPWATIAGELESGSPPAPERSVHAFAALGDSFTAGTGTPPGVRWADRVARTLRPERGMRVAYGNYAREGATSTDVLTRQLNSAIQLEPDLVTVICGANDVLESVRPDIDACAGRIAQVFDRLDDSVPGALVVTATAPERWRFLGLGPRTTRRVQDGLRALNRSIRAIATERAIPWLEVAGHPGLDDPVNFTDDGLHPSPLGHARTAEAFERLLEIHLHGRRGAC